LGRKCIGFGALKAKQKNGLENSTNNPKNLWTIVDMWTNLVNTRVVSSKSCPQLFLSLWTILKSLWTKLKKLSTTVHNCPQTFFKLWTTLAQLKRGFWLFVHNCPQLFVLLFIIKKNLFVKQKKSAQMSAFQ